MASTPNVLGTPRVAAATISVANAARDGTGTIVTVFTAGAAGSAIHRVLYKAQGTSAAGMLRMFISNGTTIWLLDEYRASAVTPSAGVSSFEAEAVYGDGRPLILSAGWSLGAATNNAEAWNVVIFGGDF